MSPTETYAVVAFLAGVLLLLGWLYLTLDSADAKWLLAKSILLFVIPASIIVALPQSFFRFPLSLWLLTFLEEALKATAAKTERGSHNRFWLISLFGIWELMLAKPLWGFRHAAVLDTFSAVGLAGLTAAGVLAVLMHCVTAEIYAFRIKQRIPVALGVCWLFHTAYDEAVGLLGVSLVSGLVLLLPLALIFVALWPKVAREPVQQVS